MPLAAPYTNHRHSHPFVYAHIDYIQAADKGGHSKHTQHFDALCRQMDSGRDPTPAGQTRRQGVLASRCLLRMVRARAPAATLRQPKVGQHRIWHHFRYGNPTAHGPALDSRRVCKQGQDTASTKRSKSVGAAHLKLSKQALADPVPLLIASAETAASTSCDAESEDTQGVRTVAPNRSARHVTP